MWRNPPLVASLTSHFILLSLQTMPPSKDTDMTLRRTGTILLYLTMKKWSPITRGFTNYISCHFYFSSSPMFVSYSFKRVTPKLGQSEKKKHFNGPAAKFLSDKVLLWKHSGLSLHVSVITRARKNVSPEGSARRPDMSAYYSSCLWTTLHALTLHISLPSTAAACAQNTRDQQICQELQLHNHTYTQIITKHTKRALKETPHLKTTTGSLSFQTRKTFYFLCKEFLFWSSKTLCTEPRPPESCQSLMIGWRP